MRKKPGALLGVGKRLVLGVGFASPLPFLPLGQAWTEGVGQDGGLSAPGTPSFAPWDVGVDHEPERVPKAWKSFPPEGGEKLPPRPPAPDCLADSGQEGQVEGRLSDSPVSRGRQRDPSRPFPP